MTPKDKFSKIAKNYASFRPSYPAKLYEHILSYVNNRDKVWDCATGNGQTAKELANYFSEVYATDISTEQLKHAFKTPNITYSLSSAEKTGFPYNYFDLITISQAMHWFDIPAFYTEAKRVAKPGSIIAVWGYGLLRIDDTIDPYIDSFYNDIVGPYWDKERKHIEDHYANILFDFELLSEQGFEIRYKWDIQELGGYLSTWSSVVKFIEINGYDPVAELLSKISPLWHEKKEIRFSLFTKIGRVRK